MALNEEQAAEVAEIEGGSPGAESAPEEAAEGVEGTPDPGAAPASEAPSAPEGDGKNDGKPETPEQKAAREKDEAIAKRWQLVEKAKAAQLAVAKEKKDLQSREQQLEQRAAQLEARAQTFERELQQARNYNALIERVRQSPSLEGLAALGFDYRQLTREMVEAGTPEAMARAADARARRLEEQLQSERAQQVQIETNRRDAHMLVRLAEEGSDYPDLANWPPEIIAEEGIKIRDAVRAQHGRFPNYGFVLHALQQRAKLLEDSKKARAEKRSAGTVSEQTQINGNGTRATKQPAGTPTLTAKGASTHASPPREMTEDEKDAWALEQLRGMRAAR